MDSLIIDLYNDANTYKNIRDFLFSSIDLDPKIAKEIKRIKRIKDTVRRAQTITTFRKKIEKEGE